MKAKCARYDKGDLFPYHFFGKDLDVFYCPCSEDVYQCWQPDEIENSEFNLIILLHNLPVRVRGIHFDFVTD